MVFRVRVKNCLGLGLGLCFRVYLTIEQTIDTTFISLHIYYKVSWVLSLFSYSMTYLIISAVKWFYDFRRDLCALFLKSTLTHA